MMSAALIGSTDVTSSRSQTWSVLVSIGRMLTEEFLQHFLSVVFSSKYWLQQGEKKPKEKNPSVWASKQKFTRRRHPVRFLYSSLPKHTRPIKIPALHSCQLGSVFTEGRDINNFCLACLPCQLSCNSSPSGPQKEKGQSVWKRFHRLIIESSWQFLPSQIPIQI